MIIGTEHLAIRIGSSSGGVKAVRATKDVDGRGYFKRRKPACFNREFRKKRIWHESGKCHFHQTVRNLERPCTFSLKFS